MSNMINNTQGNNNKKIRIRGYIASVFTVISVLISLIVVLSALRSGSADNIFEALAGGLIFGFVVGGTIPGITHIKEIFFKIAGLLGIPIVGWGVWLVLILGIPYLGGWTFMLADLFTFLKLRKEGE